MRRWLTLAYLMDRVLKSPFASLEPRLRAVLLSGATQLLLLDRIPVHAAINESVELAKSMIRPGAGAMVNAVLRKIAAARGPTATPESISPVPRDAIPLSDGRWLSLIGLTLPLDPVDRLAASTSHPSWLIRRWIEDLGAERATELALHSLATPPTTLNTAHASSPLPPTLTPHASPGRHTFSGQRIELLTLLSSRADLWVQDASSCRAIESAAGLAPRLIIDACAGQGTKTRQLRATFPRASIIATDTDPARFRTLTGIFARDPLVRVVPAGDVRPHFTAKADLILLDVPCSNSGVLARRVEAKYRCSPEQLTRLTGIQRQIFADAVPLLAPGGRILYSTCSIDREENRDLVEWAMRWHPCRVDRTELTLPAGLPGGPAAAYHDGAFHALLA